MAGCSVVDVMVAAGLQKSKGEARRMIQNGGARINNVKVYPLNTLLVPCLLHALIRNLSNCMSAGCTADEFPHGHLLVV